MQATTANLPAVAPIRTRAAQIDPEAAYASYDPAHLDNIQFDSLCQSLPLLRSSVTKVFDILIKAGLHQVFADKDCTRLTRLAKICDPQSYEWRQALQAIRIMAGGYIRDSITGKLYPPDDREAVTAVRYIAKDNTFVMNRIDKNVWRAAKSRFVKTFQHQTYTALTLERKPTANSVGLDRLHNVIKFYRKHEADWSSADLAKIRACINTLENILSDAQ